MKLYDFSVLGYNSYELYIQHHKKKILGMLSDFMLELMALSFSHSRQTKHFDIISLSEIWFDCQSSIMKSWCILVCWKRETWTRVQEDWDVTQDIQINFVMILSRTFRFCGLVKCIIETPSKFFVLFHLFCSISFVTCLFKICFLWDLFHLVNASC